MWPDVAIKRSQISPKVAQNVVTAIFSNKMMFSRLPKELPNILASFVWKIVSKTFQKSHNRVALFARLAWRDFIIVGKSVVASFLFATLDFWCRNFVRARATGLWWFVSVLEILLLCNGHFYDQCEYLLELRHWIDWRRNKKGYSRLRKRIAVWMVL